MAVQVVSFRCTLKNKLGDVLGRTYNREVLVTRQAENEPLKGLVEALKDVRPGERRDISLRAEQAYGCYDPQLVIVRRLDQLNASGPLRIGDQVLYAMADGAKRPYRVTDISQEMVTLDGNHPLAGQDLVFEIETIDAREATPDDLEEEEFICQQAQFH